MKKTIIIILVVLGITGLAKIGRDYKIKEQEQKKQQLILEKEIDLKLKTAEEEIIYWKNAQQSNHDESMSAIIRGDEKEKKRLNDKAKNINSMIEKSIQHKFSVQKEWAKAVFKNTNK